MKAVTLCDKPVRVNERSFVSLTDMWRAAGKPKAKRPNHYGRSSVQREFIEELNSEAHICAVEKIRNGSTDETWGHKYVAYDYAAWIDPKFRIGVYKVLDKFFSGELTEKPQQELHDYAIRAQLSEECASFHGKGLNKRRWEKPLLEQEGQRLLEKYQHSFNFTPNALSSQ